MTNCDWVELFIRPGLDVDHVSDLFECWMSVEERIALLLLKADYSSVGSFIRITMTKGDWVDEIYQTWSGCWQALYHYATLPSTAKWPLNKNPDWFKTWNTSKVKVIYSLYIYIQPLFDVNIMKDQKHNFLNLYTFCGYFQ